MKKEKKKRKKNLPSFLLSNLKLERSQMDSFEKKKKKNKEQNVTL